LSCNSSSPAGLARDLEWFVDTSADTLDAAFAVIVDRGRGVLVCATRLAHELGMSGEERAIVTGEADQIAREGPVRPTQWELEYETAHGKVRRMVVGL